MNATARRESLLKMSPSPLEYSLFWDDRAGYYLINLRVWQIGFCQHSNIQRRAPPSFYLQAEYRHELSNITHNLCSFCPCRCYLSRNGEKFSSDVVVGRKSSSLVQRTENGRGIAPAPLQLFISFLSSSSSPPLHTSAEFLFGILSLLCSSAYIRLRCISLHSFTLHTH